MHRLHFMVPKRIHFHDLIAYAAYWLIFILSSFPRGLSTLVPGTNLTVLAKSVDIRRAYGQGDSGSYLDVAITFSKFHQLNEIRQFWIVHLWTPGLSLLEVPGIWLEKLKLPLYVYMVSLTSLIWFLVYREFWKYSKEKKVIFIFITCIFFASWDFHFYTRDGIFMSEGISFGLLTLSFIKYFQLAKALLESKKIIVKDFVKPGCILALAILIRQSFESGLLISVAISGGFCLVILKTKSSNSAKVKQITIFSWFALFAFLATIPWRILSVTIYRGLFVPMSSTSNVVLQNIWSLPSSASAKYWGGFGSNWGCQIDLPKCLELSKTVDSISSPQHLLIATLETILKHPIEYISERIRYGIPHYSPLPFSSINNIVTNLATWVILPLSMLVILRIYILRRLDIVFFSLPMIVFILSGFLNLMIVHFETRYFSGIRTLTLFFDGLALVEVFRLRKSGNSDWL